MSLSRSERNSIIINDAKGIQHPLYYVMTDKNGKIQVRKRKVPLTSINEEKTEDVNEPNKEEQVNEPINTSVYESVTNKKLLEKMLEVLERSTESNDLNKTQLNVKRKQKRINNLFLTFLNK